MKNQSVGNNLVLGPYKEPLTAVKKGFGYMGAISLDIQGKIQCHICGQVWDNLPQHIRGTHKMNIREYRAEYQLSMGSKLVSEAHRLKLKERGLRYWHSLNHEERRKFHARRMKGFAKAYKKADKKEYSALRKLTLEHKNERGICPDQLIDLIQRCSKELDKTPTMAEFNDHYGTERFVRPIYKTFDSWNNAIKKAGLKPHTNYGVYTGERKKYSEEELLEYLQDFFAREKVLPSMSDFNRGYLPPYRTYLDRFGSIVNARKKAGLPENHNNKGGWYATRKPPAHS